MTLQARSCSAREQTARHVRLFAGERRYLLRNIGHGLLRQRLEEADQLPEFVVGERERGHADLQVRPNAVAVCVGGAQRWIRQELAQPLGIDTRALGQQLWRQLLLNVLILFHSHQNSLLTGDELVAAHAVVLLDDPPTFLNIMARIAGLVLIARRQGSFFASHQESGEIENLLFGEVQVGHAQRFSFAFYFALVVNTGLGEFVFEESFVVVPGLGRRAVGKARQVFFVFNRLGIFAAALGDFGEQREVEALDRLAAFVREFGADAAFIFETRDLVAAGAAKITDPLLAVVFQLGIVHERSIRVGGRLLFFLRHQIRGNVFGILRRQAQAGHHCHVLHLQFMAVVRTAAVVEVELVGKALLGVIFGANVFLFVRTVGASALACVVNPAHQIIVISFLADAGQIRGEGAALRLIAFSNGVAGQASAGLE